MPDHSAEIFSSREDYSRYLRWVNKDEGRVGVFFKEPEHGDLDVNG